MDEPTPDQPSPAETTATTDTTETDEQRRRRLAAVFGDVLPDTTSDERDTETSEQGDDEQEQWLRSQVPPHHG